MRTSAHRCVVRYALFALGSSLAGVGCSTTAERATFQPVQTPDAKPLSDRVDKEAPFVKAHLSDGGLVVLENWTVDGGTISGDGIEYDADRARVRSGRLAVALDRVLIVETNRPETFQNVNVAVMGVVSAASLVMTAICLTNPKTCFGSCPTFYADTGEGWELQAEGFSASVARVLEGTDVDSLFTARPRGGRFELVMTNEALETHMLRKVALLAAPRNGAARVFRAGDSYYPAKRIHEPLSCSSESGDCLKAVRSVDDREYQSPADAEDLAARERVTLRFESSRGRRGIVVGGRNSLLNTFVFYQALAYMGTRAGELMAELEKGGPVVQAAGGIGRLLGDVAIRVRGEHAPWRGIAPFAEVGPIAREVQLALMPKDVGEGPLEVELELTRGNWKIDYVGLAELGDAVVPERCELREVRRHGRPAPDALGRLRDGTSYLATFPGDRYELSFDLPPEPVELFLESTGYYYEWMRSEWLADESEPHLRTVLLEPERALRELAPRYKSIEGQIERLFWQSRVRVGPDRGRSRP